MLPLPPASQFRECANQTAVGAFPVPGSQQEAVMGLGRGALLWLLGVPIPIIILIALFWH
jgi:hypothetical protein